MNGLMDIDLARAQLLNAVHPIRETETVALIDSYDRVLAEDYTAPIDVPPADNSAMDGYAINSSDYFLQQQFHISQRIPAGSAPAPLVAGTAARIFTGAEIPAGANAVAIQEDCTQEGEQVTIHKLPTPGDNIRPRGQDIAKGSPLFPQGHLLRAQDVALLASVNMKQVSVFRRLRVAIFSTGDELIEPGTPLEAGKIYNSNRYLLHGFLRNYHCDIWDFGIVADSEQATLDALRQSARADLIISSGGVSVGEEDHVKAAVAHLGEIQLWKLNLKPGKPLAFGHVMQTPFVGLPGNPVSAFVNFELLVKPLLQKMQGQTPHEPEIQLHPAQFSITTPLKRCEFFRGQITPGGVILHPQQSSGALSSTAWANCLVRINQKATVAQGDLVQAYLLR